MLLRTQKISPLVRIHTWAAPLFGVLLPFTSLAGPGEAVVSPAPSASSPSAAAPGQPPASLQWMLIGGMIFFMWFFIIRPQAKRQKEHKLFLDGLTVGSEVVTNGGVIGRVASIADGIVTLDVGAGQMRVLKSAISGKLGSEAALAGSAASAAK